MAEEVKKAKMVALECVFSRGRYSNLGKRKDGSTVKLRFLNGNAVVSAEDFEVIQNSAYFGVEFGEKGKFVVKRATNEGERVKVERK